MLLALYENYQKGALLCINNLVLLPSIDRESEQFDWKLGYRLERMDQYPHTSTRDIGPSKGRNGKVVSQLHSFIDWWIDRLIQLGCLSLTHVSDSARHRLLLAWHCSAGTFPCGLIAKYSSDLKPPI